MKNLIACLVVCVGCFAFGENRPTRGGQAVTYPLPVGQLISNGGGRLEWFGTPCYMPPWSDQCQNQWQYDRDISSSLKYIAVDTQGEVLLFHNYNRMVYRYNGSVCCEELFELPSLPTMQPTVLGNYIYYRTDPNYLLNRVDIDTGQNEVITDGFVGRHLATDGINLFTMQHVIKGDCCSSCGVSRYSQIWTVDPETGNLDSLVCNWRHSCGTVGDATDFTCSKGYFHIIHHDMLMYVDPTPVDSIAYAAQYCIANNSWSLSSMQTANAYSGDLDCSGDVGVDDLLAMIGKWGGTYGPADLNKDGHVNIQDLLIMIASWS